MVYQMVSGKEVLARVDNNFDIDYCTFYRSCYPQNTTAPTL